MIGGYNRNRLLLFLIREIREQGSIVFTTSV